MLSVVTICRRRRLSRCCWGVRVVEVVVKFSWHSLPTRADRRRRAGLQAVPSFLLRAAVAAEQVSPFTGRGRGALGIDQLGKADFPLAQAAVGAVPGLAGGRAHQVAGRVDVDAAVEVLN